MKAILFVGTAVAALVSPASLMAQTASPTVSEAPGSEAQTEAPVAEGGLTDIIVTAQRRSESAQRAAIAIDVVSAQDLTRAGVVTAATLNAAVPALTVQQGGGANTTFFVRGVGNFTNNGYSDPAIAFNLDGVYLGRPTSTTGAFFDLERIEVLKGPQGTLYGRNATGGAINVIPAKPRLGERSLAVSGSFGNYNALDVEAAANLPIGDKAALRIAGKIVYRDGFNDDGTSDDNGQAIRAQLLVQPSDTLTLRLSGDYSHQGGVGPGASYVGAERFTPGTPATATSPENYTFTPADLAPFSGLLSPEGTAYFARQVIGSSQINPSPLAYPFMNNTYWGVTGEITLDAGGGTLTLLPAYRESKLDNLFNGPSFRGATTLQDDHQFSTEVRFEGPRVGPFDWLVGAYYFDERVAGSYALNQGSLTSFQNFVSKTTSYAGFGRITAHLADRFRLVAAGRYTRDEKQFDGGADTLVAICTRPAPPVGPGCFGGASLPLVQTLRDFVGGPTLPGPANSVPYGAFGNRVFYTPTVINAGLDNGRFTYRLAAEYDVAPASLIYASYETGYRSGGFSNATGRETYTPEYVDAITIGSKNRFFDRRVQLNVELFYWKYRDQQVSHFGLDGNNQTSFFTENIGRSTIKGVDVDAQFLVTPSTRLIGSVQYLDSQFDDYAYFVPRSATSLPPPVGCPTTSTVNAGNPVYRIDCSGKPGYNSPRWAANAGIEQTVTLGEQRLIFNGDARYRSNSVVGFDYLPQQNSGAFWTFDASVMLAGAGDRWAITGFVRNLTDEAVPVITQYAGSAANTLSTVYAPPRTYGVRFGHKF